MIDKNLIETNNNIELTTFNDNKSFDFLFNNNNKFDLDKLSIIINEQFEFIPKSIPPKEKNGTKSKNKKKEIKNISNNNKKYLKKKKRKTY